MGIYDRDYYRDDTRSWGGSVGSPGTVFLIATTIVLFFAQAFTTKRQQLSELVELFQFDFGKIMQGEVWRVLTAGLIPSSDIFTLILSMILLFWAGKEIERVYGTKPFVAFYILAAIATSLGKLLVGFAGIDVGVTSIGIAGAIFAVMVLFACLEPKRTILVFFVLPMPIALLVIILLGLAVLTTLRDGTKVHAIGIVSGAIFGFLFFNFAPGILTRLNSRRRRPARRPQVRIFVDPVAEEERDPVEARMAQDEARTSPDLPRNARAMDEQLEAKLDRVLSKVAQSGRGSLTEEEQEILQKASEIYKKKRS